MRLASSFFWFILLGSAATAQPSPPPKAGLTIPEGRFDTLSRPLQPGDQIEIHIFTLPDLEKTYQIRADGTLYHPFAGEVPAAGKTMAELERLLAQRFKKQIKTPGFRVALTSMAEAEAAVLGEVRNQGKFRFAAGTSVMDLIAQAGGISDKADRDSAILLRGGKEIRLNLGDGHQGELSKLLVRSGDILYINRGKRVGVAGEVQTKGVYAIGSSSPNSVEEAIKSAGGATDTAALNRVQIIRPSLAEPITVDMLNPKSAASVVLQDGDTVVIPPRRAVILGAVGKQGALPLTGKETLVEVVSLAGVSSGRLDAVVVVRAPDVVAGNDKKEVYDLENSLNQGNATVNVPIHDGDLVFVPPKDPNSRGLLENGGMLNLLLMARSFFSF